MLGKPLPILETASSTLLENTVPAHLVVGLKASRSEWVLMGPMQSPKICILKPKPRYLRMCLYMKVGFLSSDLVKTMPLEWALM